MKRKVILILVLLALPLLSIWVPHAVIQQYAQDKTYSDAHAVPQNKVGLVLGTARTLRSGHINLYFKYRVDATVALYEQGKIDFVLISGDNHIESYDEPSDFKEALMARGIPEAKIYLDYAGFRTLDSVVRAKEIFGQSQLTIISQQFHNERAIFLAQTHGIEAVGFNAQDVPNRIGVKVKLREYLARTKAFLDVLLGVGPKFLGEPIEITS